MLVLSRRLGEEIIVGNDISIRVVAIQGDRIRIGVTAPREVPVDRAELHARRASSTDTPITVDRTGKNIPVAVPDPGLPHIHPATDR